VRAFGLLPPHSAHRPPVGRIPSSKVGGSPLRSNRAFEEGPESFFIAFCRLFSVEVPCPSHARTRGSRHGRFDHQVLEVLQVWPVGLGLFHQGRLRSQAALRSGHHHAGRLRILLLERSHLFSLCGPPSVRHEASRNFLADRQCNFGRPLQGRAEVSRQSRSSSPASERCSQASQNGPSGRPCRSGSHHGHRPVLPLSGGRRVLPASS
jgi:hypothetical protein